ncbi:hypothetical protein [Actinophytocola sp.]|uniref:hypothetical protein n=1 Tax=Actinophytocola sp. TaxID=1872138 RepID=UPI002ED3BA69
MMVTVPQLLGLNIGELEAAADAWLGVAAKLNSARDGFAGAVVDPLKNRRWEGEAGDSAAKICEGIRLDIEAVAIESTAVQKFLDNMASGSGDGYGNLRTHQQNLVNLQHEAIGKGFTIQEDGTVNWAEFRAPGPISPEEQQRINDKNAQADALEKRVKEVLKAATEADENMARGLKVIFGDEDTFRTEHRGRTTKDGGFGDDKTELELRGVQAALAAKGWGDASGLLDHYLDGSGKPYEIDANRLLKDVPKFQQDVNTALADARKLPDGPFTTKWLDSSSPHDQNLNWYYGLNNFEYRIVGEKHGDQITYQVEVQKRYDWGIPSEHRRDLERFPVHFEQSEIARLSMVGNAKDFDVHGKTNTMTSP